MHINRKIEKEGKGDSRRGDLDDKAETAEEMGAAESDALCPGIIAELFRGCSLERMHTTTVGAAM